MLDEESQRIEVVVPDDQLSLAIGRRGQNVRLASQLTSWDIDILTEAEESERRQEEFRQRTALFVETLDVDELLAQLLVAEGFTSVEDVAFVPKEEVAAIEGFDEDTATELQGRARNFLEARNVELDRKRKDLGVADDLAAIEELTPEMQVTLGENGIKSLDDLGDLASDELLEILSSSELTPEEGDKIIMAARAHWFQDDNESPLESSQNDISEGSSSDEETSPLDESPNR